MNPARRLEISVTAFLTNKPFKHPQSYDNIHNTVVIAQ